MNQTDFHKLISGQKPGYSAALMLFILRIAAIGYSIAIGLRNFLYTKGWLKTHRANALVFSIGNITVGGTGKTPLVIWLCNLLRQKNVPCAVLTRGYKTHTRKRATSDERRVTGTDEPAIIMQRCPKATVIINPDRVDGAFEAVSKFGAKVLIMDDGFQHRRLARDLDIVTIDATQPFGYGRLLPAGLLREPISALKRADAAVITRCDQITEDKLAELEYKLQQINRNMIIARSIHAPSFTKSLDDQQVSLEEINDKKIFVFCGIGNPDAFLNTIKSLGSEMIGSKIYNDHHNYTENDIADIHQQAGRLKADLILTTQKDWTKTALLASKVQSSAYNIRFAYLVVELKFLAGEDKLTALIKKELADKIYAW